MIPGSISSPGGMRQKEFRGILMMMGLALVILLLLVGMLFFGKKNSPGKGRSIADEENGSQPSGPSVSYQEKGDDGFTRKKLQLEHIPDPGDPFEGQQDRPRSEVKPFTEDPEWDEDVVDRDENLEPQAFYYLIHRVATLPQEELERTANTKVESTQMLQVPAQLRGRRVRIQGTLIALREKDFEENRSGIRMAYIGQMVDNHGEVLCFYILDLPEEAARWKPFKDVIEVRGIFYKIWKYKNRENRSIESPLIIARTARKIPKYPRREGVFRIGNRYVTWMEIVIGIAMIILIPVMFILFRSESRKYIAFKRTQTEKRKKAAWGAKPKEKRSEEEKEDGSGGDPRPPETDADGRESFTN